MARLTFEIQSVRCRDETRRFAKIGGDDVALSGLTIDPDACVEPLPTLNLGRFNGESDDRTFFPRRVFASFDLEKGPPFPRLYQVILVLAEHDSAGGLETHVQNTVHATRRNPPELAYSGAVATALELEVATRMGDVAVEEARRAVRKVLKDDFFPLHLEGLMIDSADFLFPGDRSISRPRRVELAAANGTYQITFLWRISST